METENGTASWADVAARYQRAVRLFDLHVQPVLCGFGLDHLGLSHVLFLINIGAEPRRVADLIRDERYPGSNASYALSHLVEAGLISRQTDEVDARVRVVAVTDKGRELLSAIRSSSAGNPRHIEAALRTLNVFEAKIASSYVQPIAPAAMAMGQESAPAEAAE